MPYQATVYNLMISYPSDAEKEALAVKDCINRWNDTNSSQRGIVLHPRDYRTHAPAVLAAPEDQRPQAVINDYVLPADWLIAVFKNRIGTSTGKFESGTLEEIEEFRKSNPYKPISVYFYAEALNRKVKKYKAHLLGIWKKYKDCEELYRELNVDLSLITDKNTFLRQKFVDLKKITEKNAYILLREIANDTNCIAVKSSFYREETKIETNGHRYIGFDLALENLRQKGLIEKKDAVEEIFALTELGRQELKP
jgi:hypothetical protein